MRYFSSFLLPLLISVQIAFSQENFHGVKAGCDRQFAGGVIRAFPVLKLQDPVQENTPAQEEEARPERFEFDAIGEFPEGQTPPANAVVMFPPPKENKEAPLVLFLPMTGDRDHKISQWFCKDMVKMGFRCAYVERKLAKRPPASLEKLVKMSGFPPHSAKSGQKALDLLEQKGFLKNGEKVALAGLSLGALDAAILSASDKRIGSTALILGAGNIAKILTYIEGAGVESYAKMRKAVMEKEGLTLEQFEKKIMDMEEAKLADPLNYFNKPAGPDNPLSGEHYLMINVDGDPAMANEQALELHKAIARGGNPPAIQWIKMDNIPKQFRHGAAALLQAQIKKQVAEHFKATLNK